MKSSSVFWTSSSILGVCLKKNSSNKLIISLSQAANKYDIPYSQKFCERHMCSRIGFFFFFFFYEVHMCRSLNLSNIALDSLEITKVQSGREKTDGTELD
jgi:hypothetical protein